MLMLEHWITEFSNYLKFSLNYHSHIMTQLVRIIYQYVHPEIILVWKNKKLLALGHSDDDFYKSPVRNSNSKHDNDLPLCLSLWPT